MIAHASRSSAGHVRSGSQRRSAAPSGEPCSHVANRTAARPVGRSTASAPSNVQPTTTPNGRSMKRSYARFVTQYRKRIIPRKSACKIQNCGERPPIVIVSKSFSMSGGLK